MKSLVRLFRLDQTFMICIEITEKAFNLWLSISTNSIETDMAMMFHSGTIKSVNERGGSFDKRQGYSKTE